ncbi:MAG TPA: hypothetical protein VE011_12090 [Candidatus Dormibacteraeota bacterium]|nr:hypothetical protein [Candidatus Dormibacteraeota bacterium]
MPYLTVGGLARGTEQGLLDLAFSPGYASDRKPYRYVFADYAPACLVMPSLAHVLRPRDRDCGSHRG